MVAKKVHVIIEFSQGVRPLSIIGREGRIRGQCAELSLNQLYGGHQKYVLLEAEVPAGSEGQDREIATAKVSYDNPFTQQTETAAGAVSAQFSEDEQEVQKSANAEVLRDYQLNLNVKAQEKAIALSDKGRTHEAARELRESARHMKDTATQYHDKELRKKAEETERQAAHIEKEGMTVKSRKVLRTESYQYQEPAANTTIVCYAGQRCFQAFCVVRVRKLHMKIRSIILYWSLLLVPTVAIAVAAFQISLASRSASSRRLLPWPGTEPARSQSTS